MNTRQQLYKKYRLESYSKYTSARMAGYAHTTASRQAKRLDKVVNIDYWLEKEGLTDTALAKHAKDGLEANHKYPTITDRDEKGRPVYTYIDEPDFNVRHKYLETILKLQGKLSDKLLKGNNQNLTQIFLKIEGIDGNKIQTAREAVASFQR